MFSIIFHKCVERLLYYLELATDFLLLDIDSWHVRRGREHCTLTVNTFQIKWPDQTVIHLARSFPGTLSGSPCASRGSLSSAGAPATWTWPTRSLGFESPAASTVAAELWRNRPENKTAKLVKLLPKRCQHYYFKLNWSWSLKNSKL